MDVYDPLFKAKPSPNVSWKIEGNDVENNPAPEVILYLDTSALVKVYVEESYTRSSSFFKAFITTRIIYNKGLDCAKFLYS